MITLSVDPGVKGCGIALWDDGKLVHASYVKCAGHKRIPRGHRWRAMANAVVNAVDSRGYHTAGNHVGTLVVEVPRVYQGAKQKGDPNDLIEVAGVVGALTGTVFTQQGYCGTYPTVVRYYPYEWKKQMSKEVCLLRIKKRLSEEELACIKLPSAKSLTHNAWDAVGVGLHAAGRYLF